MFAVAPKQVENIIVPKATKGRKNKEIAFQHFEKITELVESTLAILNAIIKLQDPTVKEMRQQLKNGVREAKETKKYVSKYRNIQYKPKRTRNSCNTGLQKLRPISENMALFAGWEYGVTQKSRRNVTNLLCEYIKTNELYDENNKSIIKPDAKLKELLQVEDDVILQYPTMQKYLKNCFEDIVEEAEKEAEKPLQKLKNEDKKSKVKNEPEEDKLKKFIKKEKENNPPKTASKQASKTTKSKK
jgi:chromatin remodeling complex protein RSC6